MRRPAPFLLLLVGALVFACATSDQEEFTSPVRPNPPRDSICGDGVAQAGEMCDGEDLGVEDCATATMDSNATGTLRCSATCAFELSGCQSSMTPGAGGSGTGGTMGGGGTTGGGGTFGGGGTVGGGGVGG